VDERVLAEWGAAAAEPGRRRHGRVEVAARIALVCSVAGLPMCFWLLAYYLAQFGPNWLFQLVSQNAHHSMSRLLDRASAIGLLLAVVGLVVGVVIARRSTRTGRLSRAARWAWRLGALGLAVVLAGVLSMLISFLLWAGPA
jgi:hypothetical protein